MGDFFWEVVRHLTMTQAAVVAQAAPAPSGTAGADTCPDPRFSYSDWEKTGEDRWFEGQWVMQRIHYQRTKTDNCDGSETTQRKTEGPFRLWQAVPDERVADVNRPSGADDGLVGAPLRSSTLPTGPVNGDMPAQGSEDANERSPASKGQDHSSSPYLPSLALLLGVAVAWFGSSRTGSSKVPGTDRSAGGLLWDFLWKHGMPWLVDHREQVDRAGGLLTRVGDSISRGWNWVRSNPVGWFITEVVRRVTLTAVGLVYFVGTTIQSLFELVGGAVKWTFVTSWENAKNNWRFITGDLNTKRQMLSDFKEKWITGFDDRLASAENFGRALVQGIVGTWKRWWHGLVQVFTDPDMSSDDLIQFGEDTGSVVCDALIVAEGVGAAVRVVRGARLARVARLTRLEWFETIAKSHGYESLAGFLADKGFTSRSFWKIISATERPKALEELLSHFPKEQRLIEEMMERKFLVMTPEGLWTGPGGTFDPAKWAETADGIAAGDPHQIRRGQNIGNQIRGGAAEIKVSEIISKEKGFKRFLHLNENPSIPGIDMLAEFERGVYQVGEVKFRTRGKIGPNGVSNILKVENGIVKVDRERLLEEITEKLNAAQVDPATKHKIVKALDAADGSIIYRIELVGAEPTANLAKLHNKIIDGVRVLVIRR